MADHPNVALIRDGYAAFGKGDMESLAAIFDENIVWHSSGRSPLSGDYRGREAVFGLFGQLMQQTGGSFSIDLHSVLADDEHGVALVNVSASRGERTLQSQEANIFHISDGIVTEAWIAPTNRYAVDEFWS